MASIMWSKHNDTNPLFSTLMGKGNQRNHDWFNSSQVNALCTLNWGYLVFVEALIVLCMKFWSLSLTIQTWSWVMNTPLPQMGSYPFSSELHSICYYVVRGKWIEECTEERVLQFPIQRNIIDLLWLKNSQQIMIQSVKLYKYCKL